MTMQTDTSALRIGDRMFYNKHRLDLSILFGTVGTVMYRVGADWLVHWDYPKNRRNTVNSSWHKAENLTRVPLDADGKEMMRPVAPCPDEADPLCPGHRQGVIDQLRAEYPHGHPDYISDTVQELALHSDKNHDYAGGGDPLGNFDRVSAILQLYPGFPTATPTGVALTYALKQVDAVLWGLAQNIEHIVEGADTRLQDISVYAKLARIMLRRARS